MLKAKEVSEAEERRKEQERRIKALEQKSNLHHQMQEREDLRRRAREEYLREKEQVDNVISKMIQEDTKMMQLTKEKQEHAKQDMFVSIMEKKRQEREKKLLEEQENEMVREYARQQEARQGEIAQKKAAEEAEREAIFQRLAVEQERMRAEAEYIENLRFQLYLEETEEQARQRERADNEKRERIKQELLDAQRYQE